MDCEIGARPSCPAVSARPLNAATEAFNRPIGSFEGRVLPQLRRFEEAGAASAREVGAPAQIDAVARELAAGERGLAEVAG